MKVQSLRIISKLCGVVLVLALNGCAFGARNIALQYYPVTTLQSESKQNVAIVKFTDMRQKPEVGEVRNGYGFKTATVWAKDQDVGAWVANALADELSIVGYNVQKYKDAAPPEASVSITGTVPEAYVKMFFCERGTVRVNVSVMKTGVVVLNKEYTGKAKSLAWFASAREYEKVLKEALQNLMKQLAPDIIKAVG